MYDPCTRCKSRFPPEVCQQFCTLHKIVVAELGRKSAYAQRSDSIAKAVRKK